MSSFIIIIVIVGMIKIVMNIIGFVVTLITVYIHIISMMTTVNSRVENNNIKLIVG